MVESPFSLGFVVFPRVYNIPYYVSMLELITEKFQKEKFFLGFFPRDAYNYTVGGICQDAAIFMVTAMKW